MDGKGAGSGSRKGKKTHQKFPGEYLFPTIISMRCLLLSGVEEEEEVAWEGKTPVVKDPGG